MKGENVTIYCLIITSDCIIICSMYIHTQVESQSIISQQTQAVLESQVQTEIIARCCYLRA